MRPWKSSCALRVGERRQWPAFIGLTALLFASALAASGCGETVHGVWNDSTRIVRGVKTVFVPDGK